MSSAASDDSYFWFDGLTIMFEGADIEATRLDMDRWLKKGVGQWVNYEPQFAFVSSHEQWAEIAAGKALLEKDKSAITPVIKEAHLIPSQVAADCFVRLEVRGSKLMRVMDYQMKLITKEGEYIGIRADVRGYFLLHRSGGQFDEDGDQVWKEIRKETLRNIGLNAPVSRVEPLTGWLRFCFEGLPKWNSVKSSQG